MRGVLGFVTTYIAPAVLLLAVGVGTSWLMTQSAGVAAPVLPDAGLAVVVDGCLGAPARAPLPASGDNGGEFMALSAKDIARALDQCGGVSGALPWDLGAL
ncbi:hypothetical protein [Ketogulonicigenium vulgare]|uniref:Uncharacterized protein n=1 Tax=Ketogulonicigenium vulgare (strain WSH-001) TaxID=759362 RepID=F9YAN2_KETVW|nr:hypothetical protein [Ketogulonicigenium vulgare]ADO43272.1 hypothetical protein EIO_2170 [Ketogulonicigenium vulgare Y25]AEM41563.1 hypothetical protein KVU_1724 [Ketogulonicigenium vulgare WSH-001]ALJ81681.1 hypothetical protein KVH_11210 [Ketogulonicigenium vulgare]ANW34353.1 hypothetical protein KvSKV_11125 [Ketogulonicigenium vulgare]AOZ55309.1 hypothetical protein KVC_2304 [Ketogulonicigenium vulgare]